MTFWELRIFRSVKYPTSTNCFYNCSLSQIKIRAGDKSIFNNFLSIYTNRPNRPLYTKERAVEMKVL